MNNQIFFIIFITLGVFAIAAIAFINIYYLKKGSKKEDSVSFKFSEYFKQDLEKLISKEIRRNALKINQIIIKGISNSYKEQLEIFSKKMEERMGNLDKVFGKTAETCKEKTEDFTKEIKEKTANFEQIIQREILNVANSSSQAKELLLEETKRKFNEINKTLDKKLKQIFQSEEKTLNKEIAKVKKDIEGYKKEKLKEIDRKIYQMVIGVSKKTIGKAVDLSDHEKLVMDALERAKKEIF